MASKLWIIGTPLNDAQPFPQETRDRLKGISVFVGESRNRSLFLLRDVTSSKEIYFLDPPHPHQRAALFEAIEKARAQGQDIGLFSDTGMPISFDPGIEVLQWAKQNRLEIRSIPTATSWGTAAALSGFAPPFTVVGFPPRDAGARSKFFNELKKRPEPLVLLETPYRFLKLLEECSAALPPDRPLFLAWELGGENERLLWFAARDWKKSIAAYGLEKGEFILMVGPK